MDTVVPLARARAVERFGGKSAQLAVLTDVPEIRVPDGFAIGGDVFRELVEMHLPAAQWPERLVAGPANERRGDRLAAIRERLLAAQIPADSWQQIVAAYEALGEGVVAVRSSALHEDTEGATAAGIQESLLGIEGDESLARAIKQCFAS